MKIRQVWAVWFSGTGTTKAAVGRIAARLAEKVNAPLAEYNFTLPSSRQDDIRFGEGDLVVLGVPTYAGRVPNVLLPYLKEKLHGCGALAVPVVMFGNRNYDDALMELRELLRADGFSVVAGGAFVGEHSFSRTLGAGRPDADDQVQMDRFADAIAEKTVQLDHAPEEPVAVGGQLPIRPYYTPRDRNSNPINILKVKPKTDVDKCTGCGICAASCPMGSISFEDPAQVTGICIKCCACVKGCPTGAKYYDDAGYLYHQHELEDIYQRRANVEWFV